MTVWRINLLPRGENRFGFCYGKDIIGIGWNISHRLEGKVLNDVKKYLRLVEEEHGEDPDSGGWEEASTAIARDMQVNDLVWTRDQHDPDFPYLAKITDGWEYRGSGHPDSEDYEVADIVSVRPCQFHEVDGSVIENIGEDAVKFFDAILSHFTPKTLQPVRTILKENDAEDLSTRIWKEITGEQL